MEREENIRLRARRVCVNGSFRCYCTNCDTSPLCNQIPYHIRFLSCFFFLFRFLFLQSTSAVAYSRAPDTSTVLAVRNLFCRGIRERRDEFEEELEMKWPCQSVTR